MDKEVSSIVQKMTTADIQNELEANGVSTHGTRAVLIQRLVKLKRPPDKPTTPLIAV